jgi:hypothetical protein
MSNEPILKSKAEFAPIIERIGSKDSPVGIDAQFTHAIIIDYLQQITRRLEAIEAKLR